ncbi:MAG: flagellar basal body protein [Clostridiales bacterium]|nr:flagellar basal body protein [Clostridiales bacterium]
MGLLRPTFMGFETMKRSIEVNQKAIDIVANNLSNVDTAGYTRQRLDVASIAPSAYSARIASSRIGILGQGVEALGVGQIRDSFLDKRFRDEYAKAAYHGQAAVLLKDVQAALGDGGDITDESMLFGAIAKIFRSLNDYIYEPTLDSQANLVLAAFRNFTQVMQQLDVKLNSVAEAQIHDVGLDVDRVNEIFSEIAHYNYLINQDATVMADPNNEYFRPNELLDKRNLLLDELAGFGDIEVSTLGNGMVNVKFAGEMAVVEKEFNSIRMDVNQDNTIGIKWVATGNELHFSAGSLKANRDFLNGRGRNIQNSYESSFEGIPYYRDRLNTLAVAFANIANHSVPEQANPDDPLSSEPLRDSDGNVVYKTLIGAMQQGESTLPKGTVMSPGVWLPEGTDMGGTILTEKLFVPAGSYLDLDTTFLADSTGTLMTTPLLENLHMLSPGSVLKNDMTLPAGSVLPWGDGAITAASIAISKEWADYGPGYFIFSKHENVVGYAQAICNALTTDDQHFVSYGETFTGTFEDYIADYVTNLASQIKYQEGRFESTALMADDFLDRRDEISGVNRDEETANMLIFQKSYNAAARLMTTLDDMLDVIINRMGRVGL